MPSDLKPTTPEERERWKHKQAPAWGMERENLLRLIADHERMLVAIQKHRLDLWGDGSVGHEHDLELYQEIANDEVR